MPQFISRVLIVVEAKDQADACDAMSAMLSENLKFSGQIVEWSYEPTPTGWTLPYEMSEPVQTEDDDLLARFNDARPGPQSDEIHEAHMRDFAARA